MRTRRALAAFSVLTLALLAISASVSAAAQTTIHIPADQPTIQAGIDAAHNGDTVLVSPGTYYENIDFKGKAITVTSSGGAAATTIDGQNITSTVSFISGEDRSSVLRGFTIQHGQSPGVPTVEGDPLGGGIYINASAPSVLNNVLTNNVCSGIFSNYGAPLIQGNTVTLTDNAHSGCYFSNDAPIMLFGELQRVKNTTLISTVTGNTVENNNILGTGTTSQSFAAGIGVFDAAANIQNNIVRNNRSDGDNGGLVVGGVPAAAAPTLIIQNLIYGNSSRCGGAGLALLSGPVSVGPIGYFVINNTIANNINLPVQCNLNLVQGPGNVVTDFDTNTIAYVNNIISSYGAAPALLCASANLLANSDAPGPMLILDHNDIYSSSGNTYSSGCGGEDFSYGNISVDPAFLSPATGDFRLEPGSPAIDMGNNSASPLPQQDFAGNARIIDATGKGYPIIDMGAYEVPGATSISSTALLLSPSAYEVGAAQSLTLTARLLTSQGPFSGAVELFDNHTAIGSGTTDSTGNLTITSPFLLPGLHHFLATFSGDGTHPAAASVEVIVLADRYIPVLTLTSSPNPSSQGQPVVFTVTITSPDNVVLSPVNLVNTSTGGATLAVLTPTGPSGVATFTTSSLPLGMTFVDAKYPGDLTHRPARVEVRQTVINPAATTTTLATSLDPAPVGQLVTFTATVAAAPANGSPAGSITFSDGNTFLASQPLAAGSGGVATASFSTSSLSLGTHFIYATYVPSGSLTGSSTSIAETISNVSTSAKLTSSLNPANVGQPVTFTLIVTNTSTTPGAPSGYVAFYDGATALGNQPLTPSAATSSVSTLTTSSLSIGGHNIKAVYLPIGLYLGSSDQLAEIINPLPSVTALTAGPNPVFVGVPLTLIATVTGTSAISNGNVSFYDGATLLASVPVDAAGHAIQSTAFLAVGTHTLTAVYSGNSTYSASTSAPFTEVIQPLPQDFTITLASRTITLKTEHHTTTTLTLTSINGFADSLAITCANLPQYVTCQPKPTPASLTASGTTVVSLYLDTDSVLGYARLAAPPRPTPAPLGNRSAPIALALLFAPFSFFSALALSRKSRRAHFRTPLRLLALLLALLPISAALSGCTTIINAYDPPAAAVPGTYTIPITAAGAATHIAHTANLTLIITP
ncbi:MAG TPA: Ig-like domain repeat protein [Acidobacteriaceae bacterium]|nr:Ig-like domain repeat protein [Acidobacteriaceae bacterium]